MAVVALKKSFSLCEYKLQSMKLLRSFCGLKKQNMAPEICIIDVPSIIL